jgi:sodium transport system permease protein
MNWNQIFTVYGKELRDALRDRRTLFSMIAFPALIMPALTIGSAFFSIKMVKSAQAEVPAVMIIGAENGAALSAELENNPKLKIIPATPDYAQRISAKEVRAAIEIPSGFVAALASSGTALVKIYNYEGELRSGFAAGEIERVVKEYRERVVRHSLEERKLPETLLRPFELRRQNVAPPEKVGGNMIGGIIPYFFIFLSFMGAMYPAIDLTAGEKERGTMETILCSPVGRVELVLGKFLTVLTASLCTVLVSVLAMGASALGVAAVLAPRATQAVAAAGQATTMHLPMLDPLGLLGVVLMVIPLAVLFSALIFCLALYAKSHKEAQTYVSPLMIVIIIPAMAAMMPGVELTPKLALIPILNVSLVSKEMLSGTFPAGSMALIFGSSCFYAALALAAAVRMFNRETVLFRS